MNFVGEMLASGIQRIRLLMGRVGLGALAENLSAPQSALFADLTGKSVAIIGNSRALSKQEYGAEIDGADIVIRINRAPMPAQISHGCKTDWLALATSLPRRDAQNIAPNRILWMSHKRKRLAHWVAVRPGFFLYPLENYQAVRKLLGAPPTTGIMLIHMLAQSDAASIKLYGFDFFASLSLSGSRTAAQVPHDFAAEKAFVDALIARDDRVTIRG